MEYGKGKFSYELIEGWAKLPEGWSFRDVPGLAIDSEDRVYVFSRGNHPVTVFDREGNLLTSWGKRVKGRGSSEFPTMFVWTNRTVCGFATGTIVESRSLTPRANFSINGPASVTHATSSLTMKKPYTSAR